MPKPPPRRGVPEPSPEAHERVVRLQAVLAAMGDVDCPEAQSLREGLKKAKQAVAPGPVGERLDSCAKFVGRAEKRLQKADEALLKLQEDKATLARELAEGRARLEALRAEASQEIIGPAPPTGDPGTEEVRKFRELVETLRSQVSSFESAKEDRWRDSEELWELRREVEELRQFRDDFLASAMQSKSDLMSSLISEAYGKRRRVLALTEGVNTGPDASSLEGGAGTIWLEESGWARPAIQAPPNLVLPRQNSSQVVDPTLLMLWRKISLTHKRILNQQCRRSLSLMSLTERVVASEMGAEPEEDPPTVQDEDVVFGEIPQRVLREAFASLDLVNVEEDFVTRACVMKSPPRFLQGAFRSALRIALSEADRARDTRDTTCQVRAWKLFLLFPRILLFRPPRGGLVEKSRLLERFQLFSAGRWVALLEASRECPNQAAVSSRRRRRRDRSTSLHFDSGRVVRGTSRFGR